MTPVARSLFTDANVVGIRQLSLSAASRAPALPTRHTVRPGGGGGPRTAQGRFVGYAARGFIVCDEKRRRTIQDERVEWAMQRSRGPELVFNKKTIPGSTGPRWCEPLPGIDPISGYPFITPSAIRYKTGAPTVRSVIGPCPA